MDEKTKQSLAKLKAEEDRLVAELVALKEKGLEALQVERKKKKVIELKRQISKEKYGKTLKAVKGVVRGVGKGFGLTQDFVRRHVRSPKKQATRGSRKGSGLSLEPSEEFKGFYTKLKGK
jgi:hypothetical protein